MAVNQTSITGIHAQTRADRSAYGQAKRSKLVHEKLCLLHLSLFNEIEKNGSGNTGRTVKHAGWCQIEVLRHDRLDIHSRGVKVRKRSMSLLGNFQEVIYRDA